MGFLPKFHHKQVPEAEKKRKHIILPWIANPTTGAQHGDLCFQQRHEANTLELFFDLFFVANLATFTAYHSVTDHAELLAYIGFFGIIWGTWFAITLFDVRFAVDSVYERACKLVQMVVFVGFALAGSQFQPGGDITDDNSTNFRVISVLLAMSRGLLFIQYLVVLIFCIKAKFNKLIFPLALVSVFYLLTTAVFACMTIAFRNDNTYSPGIYSIWYVAIFLETVLVLAVSSIWRMLSFKKTHLVERMALLTLIVIGEGAIGVTKTVSALLGKKGPDPAGSAQVFSIVLVLIFLWMIYFDNAPHGHYGTIRQQIWALLHFPLHLAIVGLVEGSQQLTRAYYVLKNVHEFTVKVADYCVKEYDGAKLGKALNDTIKYYKLDKKDASKLLLPGIYQDVALLSSPTYKGLCKEGNRTAAAVDLAFGDLINDVGGAIYAGVSVKIPDGEKAADVAGNAWYVTYNYYWGAFIVLIVINMVCLYLVRKARRDVFDWLAMIARALAIGLSIALLVIGNTNVDFWGTYIRSPALVPSACFILFVIVSIDALGRVLANWRIKKTGVPYIDLAAQDHHGGHEGHNEHDEHGHGHGPVVHHEEQHDEKTAHATHTSLYDTPTAYRDSLSHVTTPAPQYASHVVSPTHAPIHSPPIMSPPLHSPPPAAAGPAGYHGDYQAVPQQV